MEKQFNTIEKLIFSIVAVLVFVTGFYPEFAPVKGQVVYAADYEENSNSSSRTSIIYDEMSDFLNEGERPADSENIKDYLKNVEVGIIRNSSEGESSEEESSADIDEDEMDSVPGEGMDALIIEDEDLKTEIEDTQGNPDKDDWRLILVNKQNPIPDDYEAELSNINDSLLADSRIIDSIYDMVEAAQEDDVDLMICSAYRSYDRQITLFNNKMSKLMNSGMNFLDAYTVGSMSVTVPGTSEHQLGLALDILTPGYTSMDDGFEDTEAGIWLSENAYKFGFILRYPRGKEDITGIIYEPWHFRYVGTEYASEMSELGVCLEEYLNGDY